MFLYVMDKESRDKLIKLGYELLKENDRGNIWIFTNNKNQTFDVVDADIPYVVSDTLIF